jgi:hypothetical protein
MGTTNGHKAVTHNLSVGEQSLTPNFTTARVFVRAANNSANNLVASFRNASNLRLLELSNAGNAVIGNTSPLSSARLYVHSVNTTLNFGINVAHTRTNGDAQNLFSVRSNNSGSIAYNSFTAFANAGNARAIDATVNSASTSATHVGVYSNTRNGANAYAMYANMSGGGTTTGVSVGYYANISEPARPNSYGQQLNIVGYGGKTAYGSRLNLLSNNQTNPTLIGQSISVVSTAPSQNTNMTGLHIVMNNTSTGSPVTFAVDIEAGAVKLRELAGSGDRPLVVDPNGVLKAGTAATSATTIYSGNATIGASRLATLTDNLTFNNSDNTNLFRLDGGTNKKVRIGVSDPATNALLSVKAKSNNFGSSAIFVESGTGNKILDIKDSGHFYSFVNNSQRFHTTSSGAVTTGTHNSLNSAGFNYICDTESNTSYSRYAQHCSGITAGHANAQAVAFQGLSVLQRAIKLAVAGDSNNLGRVVVGPSAAFYNVSGGRTANAELTIHGRTNDHTDYLLDCLNTSNVQNSPSNSNDSKFMVRNDGVVGISAFTRTTLPNATRPTGLSGTGGSLMWGVIVVTDATGGPTLAISNGTSWVRVADGQPV